MEPSPKRHRVLSKACEACKSRKAKCDSSRPCCAACIRKGTECIYNERGQPGLRAGYGKCMDQRVENLEETVRQMSQTIQSLVLCQAQAQVASTTTPISTPVVSHDISMDSGASDHHTWPISQQPAESPITTTHIVNQYQYPDLQGPSTETHCELPENEVLKELAELFFEFVNPWMKLFHRNTFITNLFSPDRRLLLHAITVISFRYWSKPIPDIETRDRYVKSSRERILLSVVDTCSIVSTQALALLAVDAIGHAPGPRTWVVMACLTAAAHQLGLEKSMTEVSCDTNVSMVRNEVLDETNLSSYIEEQEKRRLFWAIYDLDRFSSLSHGSPCGIDAKGIRQRLPSNNNDWDQPVTTEWFQPNIPARSLGGGPSDLWCCLIEVVTYMDQVHQFLLQPVDYALPDHCQEWQSRFRFLDLSISTWMETLPREVRDPPKEFDPMWIMTHATFHAVIIRMHSVAAFPPKTLPHFRASPLAAGRCRHAISSITSMCTSLKDHELKQLGPMFVFIIWVAARNLILLWTAGLKNANCLLPHDLTSLLAILRQMSDRWECAQRYADIIQFILDTKDKPDGASGLSIFNDTTRTAYGVQNILGSRVARSLPCQLDPLFDWFDISGFEQADLIMTEFGNGTYSTEANLNSDWL